MNILPFLAQFTGWELGNLFRINDFGHLILGRSARVAWTASVDSSLRSDRIDATGAHFNVSMLAG
jgi:hypothetical protein